MYLSISSVCFLNSWLLCWPFCCKRFLCLYTSIPMRTPKICKLQLVHRNNSLHWIEDITMMASCWRVVARKWGGGGGGRKEAVAAAAGRQLVLTWSRPGLYSIVAFLEHPQYLGSKRTKSQSSNRSVPTNSKSHGNWGWRNKFFHQHP